MQQLILDWFDGHHCSKMTGLCESGTPVLWLSKGTHSEAQLSVSLQDTLGSSLGPLVLCPLIFSPLALWPFGPFIWAFKVQPARPAESLGVGWPYASSMHGGGPRARIQDQRDSVEQQERTGRAMVGVSHGLPQP